MVKYLCKLVLCVSLIAIGCLASQTSSQATVSERSIFNGTTARELESYYYEDEEFVDEDDLYFPGDSGKVTAKKRSYETSELVKVEYASTDSSVVSVDSDGYYKVLKPGFAIINATGWNENNEIIVQGGVSFLVGGDVSKMTLGKNNIQAYMFEQDYDSEYTDDIIIPLVDAPDLTHCSFEITDSPEEKWWIKHDFDKEKKVIVINLLGRGTMTMTFRINGKEFSVTINVEKVSIKKTSALLAKKDKLQLEIKGYQGKIKWVSTNKKVVTVSKKGRIKAKKKTGNAIVYAQIGDHRLGCAVSVVSPKLKKVVNRAKKIAKTCTYSQPLRMNSKYYDCSSLVWKSFRSMGKTFGNKNYAPVAADMAKWCVQKKKMVKGGASEKNINKMKLRPGDIMFLTGSDNGRYKGIYHVEMFVGYRCYGFSDGKPVLTVCCATRGDGYGYGLKLVGRP